MKVASYGRTQNKSFIARWQSRERTNLRQCVPAGQANSHQPTFPLRKFVDDPARDVAWPSKRSTRFAPPMAAYVLVQCGPWQKPVPSPVMGKAPGPTNEKKVHGGGLGTAKSLNRLPSRWIDSAR